MIEHGQRIHSRLARWSGRLALFFAAMTLAGVLLHRLTWLATPVAINVFAVSAVGLGLATLLGLLSLIGIWRKGYAGASTASSTSSKVSSAERSMVMPRKSG